MRFEQPTYFEIQGTVSGEPKMLKTSRGEEMAIVTVTVPKKVQKKGEWTEETDRYDVAAFGAIAQSAKYIFDGLEVFIRGHLTSRSQRVETVEGSKPFRFIGLRADKLLEISPSVHG